ncbi:MAG: Pvc16 family protein [Myxococcota bacterium]|nr:Pvc16 family protein [Myxococcota bacterium]
MSKSAILQPGASFMSGRNVIGEVTESIQKFIMDGWTHYNGDEAPPRIEEDLKYEPMDRNEKVVFVYMYRLAHNPNLQNQKRWRQAPVFMKDDPAVTGNVYYHRPPLMVDLFYLVMVHGKFRSEAEKLLGWLMLLLNEATHLIYRPRKFILPDGREVDSLGRPYDEDLPVDDDDLILEKVSISMVDDLTCGDAINLFSLHESKYRPFLTYRARIALDGPLIHAPGGTTINMPRAGSMDPMGRSDDQRNNGRPSLGRPAKSKIKPEGMDRHRLKRDTE